MTKLEKYTGDKTYMFPNGKLATPEVVYKEYPAAKTFTFVVTTDENAEVLWGFDNLSALRSQYGIDKELTADEAITVIEEIMNTPEVVDTTPSAEERIAAALEYQVLTSLPDEEDTSFDNSESEVV